MAPDLRVGDAERDAALAALGEHFAVGRLTRDEYDERAEAVWTARTRADLAVLFTDLPGGSGSARSAGRVPGGMRRSGVPAWPALRRIPFVSVMVVLVVLTATTHLPFALLGIALWVLVPRRHWRWHPRTQAIGRRRPAGGSWA
jgi:hypothetical protein